MKNSLLLSFLVSLGLTSAASVKPEDFGPQVVLIVDHSVAEHKYVVPRATVFFNLKPMEGSHPAPLNRGDYLLCRAHDIHTDRGTFVAFRCGDDDYIVQGFGMQPQDSK